MAAKLHLPLAHVEAGLRSFNRRMPEEVNRVLTDHVAQLLLCPTDTAVANLHAEGITQGVHLTGDVMLDATRFYGTRAQQEKPLVSLTAHAPRSFYLATVHRAENTDDPERLRAIVDAFGRLGAPVVLPLHPRTRSRLDGLAVPDNVELWAPVSYLAMLSLIQGARRVLTDSGGLQKEAVWLGTPCVTLRDETEWVETLVGGWNHVVGANADAIVNAAQQTPTLDALPLDPGHAAQRIVDLLSATPWGG